MNADAWSVSSSLLKVCWRCSLKIIIITQCSSKLSLRKLVVFIGTQYISSFGRALHSPIVFVFGVSVFCLHRQFGYLRQSLTTVQCYSTVEIDLTRYDWTNEKHLPAAEFLDSNHHYIPTITQTMKRRTVIHTMISFRPVNPQQQPCLLCNSRKREIARWVRPNANHAQKLANSEQLEG